MDEIERRKQKMDEVEKELSEIVGNDELKSQLRKLSKGILLDQSRSGLGLKVGPRGPFCMAFLGNPGTGKSMAAQVVAKLLQMLNVILSNTVIEVRRIDLVADSSDRTTRQKAEDKILEARYKMLFVDGADMLMPKGEYRDYGNVALDKIKDFIDRSEKTVCIFAGHTEPMKHFIEIEGIRRRLTNIFYFDDYSCEDLAKILHLKMSKADEKSYLYGFKLHASCSVEAIATMIEQETPEYQLKKMNGHLIDQVLVKAKENLDSRIDFGCKDAESLSTITAEDLLAGFNLLDSKKGWRKTITI